MPLYSMFYGRVLVKDEFPFILLAILILYEKAWKYCFANIRCILTKPLQYPILLPGELESSFFLFGIPDSKHLCGFYLSFSIAPKLPFVFH